MVLARYEVRPYTEREIELVETFADQAAIAIENVRLFNETKEALEQQTATSAVLKAISTSAFDIQPVFEAVVANAATLCAAEHAYIYRFDGELFHVVASHGPAQPEYLSELKDHPLRLRKGSMYSRAVVDRRPAVTVDVMNDPDYGASPDPEVRALWQRSGPLGKARSGIAVPLLRQEEPVGVIGLWRERAEPFTDAQLRLVNTFADQAVIAIENARLFNETKEALERQTAVSQVLKTISQTTFDLQSVFDVVVENGTKLCRGDFGYLFRREGDLFRLIASSGGKPELLAYERTHPTAIT